MSRISKCKVRNLKILEFFSRKYVLKPPCLGFFSGIAQKSLAILWFRYSQTAESLNLREKTDKSVWLRSMIRSTRDHLFYKRFSKLEFLKTVSVIIIANSEKIKMKKSHLFMTFAFPLPTPFWFPQQIFLKIAFTAQFFGNFIFLLQRKGWDWEG